MERIGATWLGYDSITGDFGMVSLGGFPGVVRRGSSSDPLQTILGELYSTDEEGLASLDLLEGHPSWYERRKYRTDLLDMRAWMYTFPSGQGYLDTTRYDQVDGCLWLPTVDEIDFWDKHNAA